ncbi:MAG TPA: hypothetical protein VK530_13395, partial [Candidatus Acidoferrum sp.]|nr:hypothetical protein [Candidatus Acidoferrum sp.]
MLRPIPMVARVLLWCAFLSRTCMAQAPSVPTISGSPCANIIGGGFTLSASVTGAEPLNFQWFKEGRLLAHETNATLARANITHLDLGFYSVVVNNDYGSSTSVERFAGECFWFDGLWDAPVPGYSATKPNWKSVKYLNGHFIAVGEHRNAGVGFCFLSRDAEQWQQSYPIFDANIVDVEYGNGVFVFASSTGNLLIHAPRNDGAPDLQSPALWRGVPFAARNLVFGNGRFVVAGRASAIDGALAASVDGTNWITYIPPAGFRFNNVAFGNGRFVASGNQNGGSGTNIAMVLVSTNGGSWDATLFTNIIMGDIAFAAGRFRTTVYSNDFNVSLRYWLQSSVDGHDWRSDQVDPGGCGAPFLAEGNGRIAGVRNIADYHSCFDFAPRMTRFVYSAGTNLLNHSGPYPQLSLNSICYGNRKFVAVGDVGVVATSSTGTNWSFIADGRTNAFYQALFHSNVFVAVGDAMIGSSSNGVSWRFQQITNEWNPFNDRPDANLLRTVAYGEGRWVVLGPKLRLVSTNLREWRTVTNRPPFGQFSTAYSVTFGNGLFVAATDSGIEVSHQGTNWGTCLIESRLRSIAFGANTFVAVGNEGTIYTATDPCAWAPGPPSWTQRASGITDHFVCVAYGFDATIGSNSFVAVTTNGAWHGSGDGVTWYPLGGYPAQASWSLVNADKQFFAAAGGVLKTLTATYQNGIAPVTDMAFGFDCFVAAGPFGIRHLPRTLPPQGLTIAEQPQSRTVTPGTTFAMSVAAYSYEMPQ